MIQTGSHNLTRIYELDLVRVVAAAAIILTHICFFIPTDTELRSFFGILGTAGLTAFFFLSGFFVAKDRFITRQDVGQFWKKKIIRILPVMYVAILFYVVIESLNLGSVDWNIPINAWSMLSNILCLQLFFFDLRFFALWYIGTLFILYLIHIFVQRMSGDNIVKYMLISTLFFIPVLSMYFVDLPIYGFGFEKRMIDYYFVFFLGSLSGLVIKNEKPRLFVYPLGVLFGFLFLQEIVYAIGYNYRLIHISYLPVFITVIGLILFLCIANKGLYTPISSLPKTILKASYASYSTYLFHYPILCLLAATGLHNQYVFICISIPLVFVVGYLLQYTLDKSFAEIVTYLSNSIKEIRA